MSSTIDRERAAGAEALIDGPGGAARLGLWLLASIPIGWLLGIHGLFWSTALRFEEWPHPPGFYADAKHLDADSLYAADLSNPFVGYCSGTYDPKNYGLIADLLMLSIPLLAILTFAWLPVNLIAFSTKRRLSALQNLLISLSLLAIALTVFLDPLGAWDWFLD